MLNCNICLRRAYSNINPEFTSGNIRQNVGLVANVKAEFDPRYGAARRSHSTVASIKKGHHRRVLKSYAKKDLESIPSNKRRSAPGALSKGERKDALARDRNKSWLLTQRPVGEDEDIDEDEKEDDHVNANSNYPTHSPTNQPIARGVKAPQKTELRKESSRHSRPIRSPGGRPETSDEKMLAVKDQRTVENYLKDPLRLADAVLERLKRADIEGALRYVRVSEAASINCIVSWNHCIDWLMAQGEMKESLAVYNDMKKRGRKPDAHTYTIMLRGLSAQVHKRGAVDEAVKIYNSMYAPNSAVTPNSIHTNAAINVCARGGDMDALWAISGKMPERGPGSPDRITYTTIFNAIRDDTIRKVSKLGGDSQENVSERRMLFQKAISDARKVWEDVSWKWRRADLIIDEQLVCAMGRVLHGCGQPKDLEQILDLVGTTMNIKDGRSHKGPIPSLGEDLELQKPLEAIADRAIAEIEKEGQQEPVTMSEQNQEHTPKTPDLESVVPMTKAAGTPFSESSTYAKPGPKTLSLLLDVCLASRKLTHLAPAYWRTLTNPNGKYRVEPDASNVVAYLRILRVNRASQAAYETLSQKWPDRIAKDLYRRAPFVLAIRTCVRDKNNPNAFRTATKIVDLMQQKLEERSVGMFDDSRALAEMHGGDRKKEIARLKREQRNMTNEQLDELAKEDESVQRLPVDPYVLASLLTIATRTTKGWHEGVRGLDDGEIFERDPTRNHTIIALKRVGSISLQLKRLLFTKLNEIQHGTEDMVVKRRRDPRFGSRVGDEIQDLVMLTRILIATCNKVVQMGERFKQAGRAELDQRTVENCKNWMRIYGAYLQRVEKALGADFLKKRAAEDVEEPDEEIQTVGEGEDMDIAPLIERQIRAALGEATTEMLQARDIQKGRSVRHVGEVSVAPKFKSRVMERQYDTKLQKAMKTRGLDVDDNEYTPAGRRDREANHTFGTTSQRRPMIGDELGLEDGGVETGPPARTQSDDVPFAADNQADRLGRSRILDRPDVKKVWQNASQSSRLQNAVAAH